MAKNSIVSYFNKNGLNIRFNSNSKKGGKMNRTLLAGICVFLIVASVGCSTIKGVGEDLGTVGGWVTRGSDNVRDGN